MAKPHKHFTWIKEKFQHKNYQSTIFTGFDASMISPMCIMIDKLVDSIDLSCFGQYYKANDIIGGRPNPTFGLKAVKPHKINLHNLGRSLQSI